MEKMVESIDDVFEKWLEREHPSHSVYDFETLGAYRQWKQQLKVAFAAGVSHGIESESR